MAIYDDDLAVTLTRNETLDDNVWLGLGASGTARLWWGTVDANANAVLLELPAGGSVDVPVWVIGQALEGVDLGLYNGVVDPRIALLAAGAVTTGSVLEFRKARGSLSSPTVVTTGDDLGSIDFYGAVAAGEWVRAAQMRADMSGTIATTRGPGTLTFLTATDAAPSVLTAALTLGADQSTVFGGAVTLPSGVSHTVSGTTVHGDDVALAIGGGSAVVLRWETADANANELHVTLPAGDATDVPVIVIGQGAGMTGDLGLYNGVTEPRIALLGVGAVTTAPVFEFRKARGTVAAPTVVTTGDDLGSIDFYGAVAAGEYVRAATMRADMVGTIATTRGPGSLTFATATDAAPSVMTDALSLKANQAAVFGGRQVLQLANTDVDAQNNTLTIAQIAGGIVTHTSAVAGGTVTTDTAANIIAGSGAAPALTADGQTLVVYYINDGTQTLTFAGGASVTVSDTGNTVLADESVMLLFVRTGAGTVTMHIVGS